MTTISYERGEEKCNCCGALIRNIVRIDGAPYGLTCAQQFVPSLRRVRDFDKALQVQRVQREVAEKRTLTNYAYSILPLSMQNRTTAFYREYITARGGSSIFAMPVMAILAARGAL